MKYDFQTPLTYEIIKKTPKVILHDHLDGGLRPGTIMEFAKEQKVELPSDNEEGLKTWFLRGASRGSLELYLEGFAKTIGVMQTPEALERIAFEAVEDVALDGAVYFEVRFAPIYHVNDNMNLEEVVNSVLRGLKRGGDKYGVTTGLIICAMRNMDPKISMEMAELSVDFRERGVLGFDLAGDEKGHPPRRHLDAFQYIQRKNFNITIHAGEAFGMESIWQAVQFCGAHRIGHGTHLMDDMAVKGQTLVKMGTLAQFVLDKRVPLEICPSSNIQTHSAPSFEEHPFPIYFRYNFRVTINTDNRLMSDTTQTKELALAAHYYQLTLSDIEKLTINAMKSAFVKHKVRCNIIYNDIKPAFRKIRETLT